MMLDNFSSILLIIFLVFLFIGLGEYLYKKKVAQYLTRKVSHIGSCVVAASLPLFIEIEIAIVLGIGFLILLLFSKQKQFLDSIHKTENYTIGSILFIPGVALSALIFWPINILIFQGSMLILGLSDGFAAIIGARYGKRKFKITGEKTVEGSITFFLITVLILIFVLIFNDTFMFSKIFLVLGASLFLTVTEALFGKGWDNLFIPILAGLAIFVIL